MCRSFTDGRRSMVRFALPRQCSINSESTTAYPNWTLVILVSTHTHTRTQNKHARTNTIYTCARTYYNILYSRYTRPQLERDMLRSCLLRRTINYYLLEWKANDWTTTFIAQVYFFDFLLIFRNVTRTPVRCSAIVCSHFSDVVSFGDQHALLGVFVTETPSGFLMHHSQTSFSVAHITRIIPWHLTLFRILLVARISVVMVFYIHSFILFVWWF